MRSHIRVKARILHDLLDEADAGVHEERDRGDHGGHASSGATWPESRTASSTSMALERDLQRKEKALAEAAALLVLRKKAEAIWGDGEDA